MTELATPPTARGALLSGMLLKQGPRVNHRQAPFFWKERFVTLTDSTLLAAADADAEPHRTLSFRDDIHRVVAGETPDEIQLIMASTTWFLRAPTPADASLWLARLSLVWQLHHEQFTDPTLLRCVGILQGILRAASVLCGAAPQAAADHKLAECTFSLVRSVLTPSWALPVMAVAAMVDHQEKLLECVDALVASVAGDDRAIVAAGLLAEASQELPVEDLELVPIEAYGTVVSDDADVSVVENGYWVHRYYPAAPLPLQPHRAVGLLHGPLQKQGPRIDHHSTPVFWKSRWFVLLHDRILSFRSELDPVPIGSISLKDTIVVTDADDAERCLKLVTADKTWYLAAETDVDFARWSRAIKALWALHTGDTASPNAIEVARAACKLLAVATTIPSVLSTAHLVAEATERFLCHLDDPDDTAETLLRLLDAAKTASSTLVLRTTIVQLASAIEATTAPPEAPKLVVRPQSHIVRHAFVGLESFFTDLEKRIAAANTPVIIVGHQGSGVTTTARVAFKDRPQCLFVEARTGCRSVSVKRVVAELVKQAISTLGMSRDDFPLGAADTEEGMGSLQVFPLIVKSIAAGRKDVVIVLDGLDQVDPPLSPEEATLSWLPQQLPHSLSLVLTSSDPDHPIVAHSPRRIAHRSLARSQRQALVSRFEPLQHPVEPHHLQLIVEAGSLTRYPLFLIAVLADLTLCAGPEIAQYASTEALLAKYLMSPSLAALYVQIFLRFAGTYSLEPTRAVLVALALARQPLTLEQLERAHDEAEGVVSALRQAVLLDSLDGKVELAHPAQRDAILQLWLAEDEHFEQAHERMLEICDDPVEHAHHLAAAKREQRLLDLLCQRVDVVVGPLTSWEHVQDLRGYWRMLEPTLGQALYVKWNDAKDGGSDAFLELSTKLGRTFAMVGDSKMAVAIHKAVIARCTSGEGSKESDMVAVKHLASLGLVHQADGEYADALAAFKKALALMDKRGVPRRHPVFVDVIEHVADMTTMSGVHGDLANAVLIKFQ